MILLGGLTGGFILGMYLLLSNLIGLHDNEAFSGIKWEGYKNFLRFHISEKTITIYPVGIKKITTWKKSGSVLKGFKPKLILIEKPVVIDL